MVGNTHPHRLAVFINLRQGRARRQYKSESPRQITFQQLEIQIIQFGIFTHPTQFPTNNRQIDFLRIDSLNPANPLHSTHVQSIAAQRINRIGRINHNTPFAQHLHRFSYLRSVGILLVYFQSPHRTSLSVAKITNFSYFNNI